VTIDKPSGLLTIAGNLTTVGNWWHKAGAVNAIGSEVVVGGNQWGTQTVRTNGMAFDDLRIEGGSYQTVTALSNLDVQGGFFLYSTGNDGPLVFKAPAVLTVGRDFGTTAVHNKFHPNFVAGSGKVVFTANTAYGAGPQIIAPTGVEFNDVEFALHAYRSVTIVNPWTPTGDAPVRANGDLTISNAQNSVIDGGVIAVRGAVRSLNPDLSGTATVRLDGAGDQVLLSNVGVHGAFPSIVIDKPTGVVHIQNAISVGGDWTNVAGGVDPAFGTVRFDGRDAKITSRGQAFYSVDLPNLNYSTVTLVDTLKVSKNLTLGGSFAGRIEVEGNVTTSVNSGSRSGTIAFVGNNYQALTGVGVGSQVPGVEIVKTGGALAILGDLTALGDWTHASGKVNAAKSTVTFAMPTGGTQTVTSGTMAFGNVVLSGGGYDSRLKLVGNLTASGDVTLTGADSSGLDPLGGDLIFNGVLVDSNPTFANKVKVHA